MKYLPPHISLLLTILCQVIGFSLGAVLAESGCSPGLYLSVHALAAAGMAQYLALPLPWFVLNAVLPLAAPLVLGPEFEIGWWAPVLVLLVFFIPTFWTKVPFYPTNRRVYETVLSLLPEDRPFQFFDAGCGFGSLLAFLARRRPLGRFVGVELSPVPFLIAALRGLRYGKRMRIGFRSFWDTSFSDSDFVYAFLAPPPMARFGKKCRNEMKPGSVLLVNSFPTPDKAERVLRSEDAGEQEIFVYRI